MHEASELQLAAFDWILLAAALASLMLGAWRGLVYEVLSLLAWVAAFIVAQWFAADAAQLLPMTDSAEAVRYAAGFILVFIATLFACSMLAWLAKRLIDAVGLRPVDRVLGAVFGLVRAGVLVLVLGVLAQLTPVGSAAWWTESFSGPRIAGVLQELRPVLPERLATLLPA